jgi:hypothetical protein
LEKKWRLRLHGIVAFSSEERDSYVSYSRRKDNWYEFSSGGARKVRERAVLNSLAAMAVYERNF